MFLKLCLITADVDVCEVAGLPTFRERIGPIFKHHSSWTV